MATQQGGFGRSWNQTRVVQCLAPPHRWRAAKVSAALAQRLLTGGARHGGDGMRRPVSRRDALGSQLVTHSKCKRRPAMRKDTSKSKQQISGKAERGTRKGWSFTSESIWEIRTATFVFWIGSES